MSEWDGQPVRAAIVSALPCFMGPQKKTQDQMGLIWGEVRARGLELKDKENELISTVYKTMHSSVEE